jgi:hypothetical protein
MKATEIEDYTDDDILQDGESVRVPMMLLDADSVQRAVATSQVTDAFALHKPGIRDARTLHGARAWGRTPESRRQHKRELEQETADRDAAFAERGQYLKDAWKTPAHISGLNSMERLRHQTDASPEDARAAAYDVRLAYLKDAYRQPFRDHTMQQGYGPRVPLDYGARDLRGPRAETGAGGDSDSERAAMKARASNAWRTYDPHHPPALASSSPHQKFDPAPGGSPQNEQKIAEELAAARDHKQQVVSVAREDYMRRTGEAWRQGSARFRQSPKNATAIEAQREKWLGK